jgi:hypothetical protein
MKNLSVAYIAIGACLLLSSAGVALAGQPGTNAGVNCSTPGATITPGGSASAPGSPFNPAPGTAGTVYANTFNGSAPSAHSPAAATSQYDIACKNVTQIP